MKMQTLILASLSGLLLMAPPAPAHGQTSIGVGIHYLRNLGDITDTEDVDFNQNSVALQGSVKQSFGQIASIDAQVGYIFDYLGTDESAWEPAVWGLLGSVIYGGAGIGWQYSDGDWSDDPFYALRGGVNVPIGDLELDVYGSWRFQNSEDLEDLDEDLDSITFAALLRFAL